ncbi:MAG: hypothetical protein ACK2U9_13150 [Anaerolineae bacterium]
MNYTVYIDDNYHYMDQCYRSKLGSFECYADAVRCCEGILERNLQEHYENGMGAEELVMRYRMFGEDPFIVPPDEAQPMFSAWSWVSANAAGFITRRAREAAKKAAEE